MKQQLLSSAFLIFISINSIISTHRTKRFLTFPRTSPTRFQFIIGIGVPVELEFESVTIGWVQKAEFFMPENATNYLSFLYDPFDLTTRPIGLFYVRKKRDELLEEPKPTENPVKDGESSGYDSVANEKYEKHQVEAEVVETGTEANIDKKSEADYWNQEDRAEWMHTVRPNTQKNLNVARWGIYKSIAVLAESQGLTTDGRSCVLRAICESAHASFDYSNGILGELMHIVMTPSLTKDEVVKHDDYEYFHAEQLGKDGAPCENVFQECQMSILEQFSGIYTPIMDLINNITT